MESEKRNYMREHSPQILYEDERYMVGASNRDTDGHEILVGETYAHLGRGILDQMARADTQGLTRILENISPEILFTMGAEGRPVEELGWVLAKAVVQEQEGYIQSSKATAMFLRNV